MTEAERESRRQEAILHYRSREENIRNLTPLEISELEYFEFRHGPSTVDEQVRRYYLKLKSDRPEGAEKMAAETSPLLERGITSESDVEELCGALYKYWSGFLIRYNKASYTMHNNQFQKV